MGGLVGNSCHDVEQRVEAMLVHRLQQPMTVPGQLDERSASVLAVGSAVHESLAHEAVDDAARVGLVDPQVLGQRAHAARAVGRDREQDTMLRHRQCDRSGGHGPEGDAHQDPAEVEQRLGGADICRGTGLGRGLTFVCHASPFWVCLGTGVGAA
jgi:hypothetical protein